MVLQEPDSGSERPGRLATDSESDQIEWQEGFTELANLSRCSSSLSLCRGLLPDEAKCHGSTRLALTPSPSLPPLASRSLSGSQSWRHHKWPLATEKLESAPGRRVIMTRIMMAHFPHGHHDSLQEPHFTASELSTA
jgi:hypothetical protein